MSGPPFDVEPTTFTEDLLESTRFWNDTSGFWVNYNTAIGAQAETVYGIASDQGAIDSGPIGITTASLTSDPLAGGALFLGPGTFLGPNILLGSGPVTEIPVAYLGADLDAGLEIILVNSFGQFQTWTVLSSVLRGATAIPVTEAEVAGLWPYDTVIVFPQGSQVQVAYEPGWSSLLDPIDCPDQFLAFLGQFVGIPITRTTDPVVARSKILDNHAHDRGTTFSVLAAAAHSLIGTQSVIIIERTAANGNLDPYHFILVVRPEEVLDVNQLIKDVNDSKPGGVMWTLVQTDGWTISQMEEYPSPLTVTTLEGDFVTTSGLESKQPGA